MTPTKISETHVDEIVRSGLAARIPVERGVLKLSVPLEMRHRTVYLYLEAITTAAGEDFELEAELEFRRSGVGIHAMPASIAENGNASGLVQKSRVTAFANVMAGTTEGWFVEFGSQLTGGAQSAALTPQKIRVECDEIWLNLLGSRSTGNSFSGWRAFLAVRSSVEAL